LRRLAIDVSPLRDAPEYRAIFIGQLISVIGRQITVVAVPYQVYLLSHSSLAVGSLGLFQLIPYVLCSLLAGTIADRVDRRVLLLWTQVLLAACSALFMAGAWYGRPPLWFVYLVAAVAAGISAVDQPARSATIPNLVRRSQLAGALSLNYALFQTGALAGPAVGGLVIARVGLPVAYAIDVATFGAAMITVFLISPQVPSGRRAEAPLQALLGGFAYLRQIPVVLGGYALDLNAMILSLPRALFPAMALTVYHAGPAGLGLLFAAPGVGAMIGSFLSGFIRHLRHPGRVVLYSVIGWGVSITLFGVLTISLPLALLFLAVAGGVDAISAICRNTIQQTIAPDRLRGRLSAVTSMVVVGGPYLGDVRAGAVGTALGPEVAIVVGGLMCLGGCAVIPLALPQLWNFDITSEHALDGAGGE
jgi:MFS family permease